MNQHKAFTLTELMVVVILIGIIAAFALPNYSKSIAKAHERDAIVQLMAIHAACTIYHAQANQFPPFDILDLTGINRELGLNVIANGMVYEYQNKNPDQFTVTATWAPNEKDSFIIRVNQDPLNQGPDDFNPCCSQEAGECPSLSLCS